jgi:cytochrome c biogenesis protein CcmG/thiol:disulfide interchange protein DsbE
MITVSESTPNPRTKSRFPAWAPVLAAACAIAIAAFFVLRPSSQAPGLVGKPAPEFNLRDISGKVVTLASFRGHPVLLNFWGTTCPPCRREVPLLQQAYASHRGDGLVVIGLDAQLDSAQEVSAFSSERSVSYLMLLDPDGLTAPRYGVNDLPHSFFIDRNGIVRGDAPTPFLDATPLEHALAPIL